MKQIADELGVNKMRVYRTISRLNLTEAFKRGQTLYFNQDAKDAIEQAINQQVSLRKQLAGQLRPVPFPRTTLTTAYCNP